MARAVRIDVDHDADGQHQDYHGVEQDEDQHQQQTVALVGGDKVAKGGLHGAHQNFTWGACCTAAFSSELSWKKSAALKPNMPPIRLAGKRIRAALYWPTTSL